MDIRNHLILLLKNNVFNDQTQNIARINRRGKYFDVIFVGNSKRYTYRRENVISMSRPQQIDPASVKISNSHGAFSNCSNIFLFSDRHTPVHYYRIFFFNGKSVLYSDVDLRMEKNILFLSDSRTRFEYLRKLATVTGIKCDDGTLLAKQYQQITFVSEDSALARYLSPSDVSGKKHTDTAPPAIFPFGCNGSQMKAVEKALSQQISIIEGPPGTGKTQTILNLIANIFIKGQSVAVVSNNNSATNNVLEKLQKYNFDFLVATLGNQENKQQFLSHQSGNYPDLGNFFRSAKETSAYKKRALKSTSQLRAMLDKQARLAILTTELAALQLEESYFHQFFPNVQTAAHRRNTSSKSAAHMRARQQVLSENEKNLSTIQLLTSWLWYGIGSREFYKNNASFINSALIQLYYALKNQELLHEMHALENELAHYHFAEKLNRLTEDSLTYFRSFLWHYFSTQKRRPTFSQEDLRNCPSKVVREYPVVLSTTHSLRTSLQGYEYDYVIIDESSQVDLVTGALALSCAKNIVIVGDRKQLPNIVDSVTSQLTMDIYNEYDLPEGYSYAKHSILSSICTLFPAIEPTLLREHYRCHPKIIGFCNQRFYDNQRQIDEIKDQFLPELCQLTTQDEIGIISPYRAQKQALLQDSFTGQFEIDTIHKFQGREKDAVIITTVDNQISTFTDNPNMLNVAVSRAKKYLRVILSADEKNKATNIGDLVRYIQYNDGEILPGRVRSIFDLLYKGYQKQLKSYLKKYMPVSEFDSENLMYGLLQEILSQEEFSRYDVAIHQPLYLLLKDTALLSEEETRFVKTGLSHTDFLIFNRLDKVTILVIEVDGYDFHVNNPVQSHRDELKDSILTKHAIPFLRCRTNESDEEHRILKALRSTPTL